MSTTKKIGSGYEVRFVEAELLRPLRHAVLRPGFPYESTIFDGDDVPTSVHAVAIDKKSGDVAGIGSLVVQAWAKEPDTFAFRLRGMAVDDKHRGSGAGRVVLGALEQHARDQGAPLLWCNARIEAVGFYKKSGWEVIGEQYEIPTVGPHFTMIKRLSGTTDG
jgi:GNAT superfamily N-acetyltransferase